MKSNPIIPSHLSLLRAQEGFTLIEILMVTALLAILSATVFATWNGVVRSKSIIDQERVTIRSAQYVMSRMMRELAGFEKDPLSSNGAEKSENPAPGEFGAPGGQNVSYLIGTHKTLEHGSNDSIRFVSSSAGQAMLGTLANFGLVEIEYRLEKPKDISTSSPELAPEHAEDEYVLVREEKPAAVSNTDLQEKRRFVFPVAEHLTSLGLRYFDGALWKDSWESANKNLPEAVEITLAFKTPLGAINQYRTAVGLYRREPGS